MELDFDQECLEAEVAADSSGASDNAPDTTIAAAALQTPLQQLEAKITGVLDDIQGWVDAVRADSSWDSWDDWYKHFATELDTLRAEFAGHIQLVRDQPAPAPIPSPVIRQAAAAPTDASILQDALRWRALMATPQMNQFGWSGFGGPNSAPDPSGSRHFGMNFWSRPHLFRDDPEGHALKTSEAVKTEASRKMLTDFVDIVIKLNDLRI